MQRIHADNNRNESQIDFMYDDRRAFSTPEQFYATAIRLLWAGWDSDTNTEKYVANANKRSHTIDELRTEVAECLAVTPVAEFTPELDGIESAWSFRDDWNVKELVWCSKTQYWFMSWDTVA